jgi:hypothetical protein
MSSLAAITYVCTQLVIDFESVELVAGYKEVLFTLPEAVIASLRDENDELAGKYEAFCEEYGIWYRSDYDLWSW